MLNKKLMILSLIVICSSISYSNSDPSLEKLKNQGIISEEEYEILNNEYKHEGKLLYNLLVNGEAKNKVYPVFIEGERIYFPLFSFLDTLNFKNFKQDKEIIEIELGDTLEKITINVEKDRIIKADEEIKHDFRDIKLDEREIYLEQELFKKLFLNNLNINTERQKVNMTLSFASPEEIQIRLKNSAKMLDEKTKVNDIVYTNNNKMFELGYLRTEVNQIFTKDKNSQDKNKKGFESDWEANLEYQGAFLYGELTAEYDVREHMFRDVKLRYDDIWKEHTLELSNYSFNKSGARENQISFRKEEGYFVTRDKNYMIRENVPIGSRVELIYLGTVIDIQTAENGTVVFNNKEVKDDREYTLKIYSPDGKIFKKIINTTSDYNQQNKGEVEYDFNIRENHDIKKPSIYANAYYGLTESITVGATYYRDPEDINGKYKYLDRGRGEVIYSDSLKSYPITLKVGGEQVFNEYIDDVTLKNTKDDYKYDYLGQIDLNDLRLKFEQENYGKFYDDKRETRYSARYRAFKSLDLEYEHEIREKYRDQISGETDKENIDRYSIEYSKSYKNFLLTTQIEKSNDEEEKDSYSVNLYYTGLRSTTLRWENEWKNNGKDYEVALSMFSNGNDLFDYTLEARYSEEYKDMLTFRFDLNYNNWFNFESRGDKEGNQEYKVGIDRITDLRKPKANIRSMDSSPVKAIAFVDINNNNKKDPEEKVIKNVDIKIGDQTKTTNKDGYAMFYGVPNDVIYELEPTLKKPSHLLGNNKIQVRGRNTATIEAYIPVKPMISLTGIVKIYEILGMTTMEQMRVYDNILVKVKDIDGKVLDMAIPDETGVFEVSGLLPKKYFLEVTYMGLDYSIKGINEIVQLSYVEKNEDGNVFVFNVTDKAILISKAMEVEDSEKDVINANVIS